MHLDGAFKSVNDGLLRTIKVAGKVEAGGIVPGGKVGAEVGMSDQKKRAKEGSGSVGRKVKSRRAHDGKNGQPGQAALDLLCAVCVEQGSM